LIAYCRVSGRARFGSAVDFDFDATHPPAAAPSHNRKITANFAKPIFLVNQKNMRQLRAKRYRKAMAVYQTSFQFRDPYQVLLSADFILAAHRFKLDLSNLLQRTFQAPLKLSTIVFIEFVLMFSDYTMQHG
jgi:hypothetical protein